MNKRLARIEYTNSDGKISDYLTTQGSALNLAKTFTVGNECPCDVDTSKPVVIVYASGVRKQVRGEVSVR